jgi:hypothetical protein
LRGHIGEHDRFLLRLLLEDLEHVESTVEEEIALRLTPHEAVIERLCTIPGVDRVTACQLGRVVSGQSRERRQADEQPDAEGKPVVAARAVPVGLGGDA